MRTSSASAPGKIILCGEHAVVYNRPAIALPMGGIRAWVCAEPAASGSGLLFDAPDLGRSWSLRDAPDDPLSQLAARLLADLGAPIPDLQLRIESDIPIASGMGSGAAIATALVRTLADFLGQELPVATISALVYESEKRYHGTPSGIDNTVVAYEQPIWFQRTFAGQAPQIDALTITQPFTLIIGDTGIRSATKLPVGAVRQRWQADPASYEYTFDQIGALVTQVRDLLVLGQVAQLGPLLNRNHTLLQQIGVSSPELDRLTEAACAAGACGAKLSGAGWGGIMLALVEPHDSERVRAALVAAGATRVLETVIMRHPA
jgi:mevalonate kinase